MSRGLMTAIWIAIALLLALGVFFIKDSYKMLPLAASKEGAPGPFTSWHSIDSPTGHYKVMMPAIPQHATQNIVDPKTKNLRHYDMSIAQKSDGSMFMVSLITFQGTNSSPDILKKTVINDLLAANPQNQLKEMEMGSFQGYPSINFTIANSDTTVKGLTFIEGNTLYLLSAVFPNQYYSAKDYDYFIKSFDLDAEKPLKMREFSRLLTVLKT